jgi:hypothetical protein
MLTRGWGVASTAVTILALTFLVNPVVQGYYYGFLSLLLLQQLLATGLAVVILQFVSHEWLRLRMIDGVVVGDEEALDRLGSIVRIAENSFRVIAVVCLVVLLLAGPILFGQRADPGVDWWPPWLAVALVTSASLLLQPMLTTLEGTGRVALQQRAMFTANVVGSVAGWLALAGGMGLFAIALIVGVRTLLLAAMLRGPFEAFGALRSRASAVRFADVWTLQWRVTSSWLFGLLIYHSLVPIAFRTQGPVVAGQIGVMAQAFHAIMSVAGAWLVPAQPEMGRLAAAGDLPGLRRLTGRTVAACGATALAVGLAGLIAVAMATALAPDFAKRLGDFGGLVLLVGLAVLSQPAAVMASAVRLQKKEPFLTMGLVCGVVAVTSMAVGAATLGLQGIVLGFCGTIALGVIPWTVHIYRRETAARIAPVDPVPA